MDENGSPAEINSIDCFNKKRKLQEELLELPLSKHACRHQNRPIAVFPSDCYSTEPNKEESDESGQEPASAEDSNSLHYNNGDSIISADDEFKTDLEYPEIYEASTSSASWAGTFPAIQFYPSLTKSNPSQTESLSLAAQINFYPYYQCGTEPSLNYEEHLEEFGNNGVEEPMDKESAGNYVLSSGRWSVNDQDTQQERNQLTIDKEFEQYFSMLMM